MSQIDRLLNELQAEASKNNEYDNRDRLAEARTAVDAEIRRLIAEARKKAVAIP